MGECFYLEIWIERGMSSSSLNVLIDKVQQQLSELDDAIHQLASTPSHLNKGTDLSPITATFAVITTNLSECSDLARREPNADQRYQYQNRIREMRRQYDDIKNQLDAVKVTQFETHKRQMLGARKREAETFYASNTEYLQSEHFTLHSITQKVDEIISIAGRVQDALGEQKDRLIKASENALGGIKGLETSKRMMRTIFKRLGREKWIFWGGMALIVLVLLYFAFY